MKRKSYENHDVVNGDTREAPRFQGFAAEWREITEADMADPDKHEFIEDDFYNCEIDYARARYLMGLREVDYDWESNV